MKLYLISSVVLVAIIAIGTLEALPSPIRFVTPRPGIDYKIRNVTPDSRIRYLRSIPEELLEDPNFIAESLRFSEPIIIGHPISRRSPERIVINYKPPPQNGPRHARSANAEEIQGSEQEELKRF